MLIKNSNILLKSSELKFMEFISTAVVERIDPPHSLKQLILQENALKLEENMDIQWKC